MNEEIRACRCTDFWAFHHPDCPAMQTIRRLRAELAACKNELREIAAAADDARVHNTLTLAEYVTSIRAELAECRHLLKLVVCEGCDQLDHGPDKAFHGFNEPCPILERIDAALAKGE